MGKRGALVATVLALTACAAEQPTGTAIAAEPNAPGEATQLDGAPAEAPAVEATVEPPREQRRPLDPALALQAETLAASRFVNATRVARTIADPSFVPREQRALALPEPPRAQPVERVQPDEAEKPQYYDIQEEAAELIAAMDARRAAEERRRERLSQLAYSRAMSEQAAFHRLECLHYTGTDAFERCTEYYRNERESMRESYRESRRVEEPDAEEPGKESE